MHFYYGILFKWSTNLAADSECDLDCFDSKTGYKM